MLYMIEAEIDYAALGDDRDKVLAAEHARTQALHEEGIAVAEWRIASGAGVIAIWDCESHERLNELLRGLPIARYLVRMTVTPLIPHPLWPDGRTYAGGTA
ncbi:MAG: muconolactone Delta-isomerase family protein [Pseudomonadota bacterium]|nr:muconolactone Delta-isomerase family protein [Pseudomonadota bacterium]